MPDFGLLQFASLSQFSETLHISLIVTLLAISLAILTTLHILKHKKNGSSAIIWIAISWLSPFLGPFLYLVLGINRIQNSFGKIKKTKTPMDKAYIQKDLQQYQNHFALMEMITQEPMISNNCITALVPAPKAFESMLSAIENAKTSITISTYIFDRDEIGLQFINALENAKNRGVEVRVLIDAIGSRYSFFSTYTLLKKRGIPCAKFSRNLWIWHMPYINLRNHRKIMVVDGIMGFTGGINIRSSQKHDMLDTHFKVDGWVVRELQNAFCDDWFHTTKERLEGEKWFGQCSASGDVSARCVLDGPDENFDTLRMTFSSLIMHAKNKIRIVTPYFLPDPTLLHLLCLKARSGVQVQIVIPSKNNLLLVQWAMVHGLEELLESGCEIFHTPPPFDHSKLLSVDDTISLIGSANWDARSLFLNFEIVLECFGESLHQQIQQLIDQKLIAAKGYTLENHRQRSIFQAYRSKFAYLFAPYL